MKESIHVNYIQIVWGVLLLLAGIGVFYRIPQVMPKLAELQLFPEIVVKFCFYFIGIILIGGGIRKIYTNAEHIKKRRSDK